MGPTLYAKLIESKKTNSILTLFTDAETNEDINAMDFTEIMPEVDIDGLGGLTVSRLIASTMGIIARQKK